MFFYEPLFDRNYEELLMKQKIINITYKYHSIDLKMLRHGTSNFDLEPKTVKLVDRGINIEGTWGS